MERIVLSLKTVCDAPVWPLSKAGALTEASSVAEHPAPRPVPQLGVVWLQLDLVPIPVSNVRVCRAQPVPAPVPVPQVGTVTDQYVPAPVPWFLDGKGPGPSLHLCLCLGWGQPGFYHYFNLRKE